ncbi:PadR family transcriptional regulator [Clostridium sp. E02]|uniref:PadR family transcriptional regulator n=1 Tax=Clostridium sp. E02 TaxID=2487134 RepID=UPI000F530D0F|nr:PadR family transcriptional regulator [Clostridium sp. E02]
MIPLYILGILLRFGPQHGYQIRKLIEQELKGFTQIKLSNVYYHLDKMESSGILAAIREKQEARPEKTVYYVEKTGASQFKQLLTKTLDISYQLVFDIDAALYFSEYIKVSELEESLNQYIIDLKQSITELDEHRSTILNTVSTDRKLTTNLIFNHHRMHYETELRWAEESLKQMESNR